MRRLRQHALLHVGRDRHLLRALGDHLFQTLEVRLVLELQIAAAQRIDDSQVELGRSDRLHEIGMRAVLDRRLAEVGVVDAGHHHDRDVRAQRTQLAEQAVAGLVRQPHVEQHDRIVDLSHSLAGLGTRERGVDDDPAALQNARH